MLCVYLGIFGSRLKHVGHGYVRLVDGPMLVRLSLIEICV